MDFHIEYIETHSIQIPYPNQLMISNTGCQPKNRDCLQYRCTRIPSRSDAARSLHNANLVYVVNAILSTLDSRLDIQLQCHANHLDTSIQQINCCHRHEVNRSTATATMLQSVPLIKRTDTDRETPMRSISAHPNSLKCAGPEFRSQVFAIAAIDSNKGNESLPVSADLMQ